MLLAERLPLKSVAKQPTNCLFDDADLERLAGGRSRPSGWHQVPAIWMRLAIGRSPVAYGITKLLQEGRRVLSEDFDLLVEGFPRSANTHTAAAFRYLDPKLKVCSHRHSPAVVRNAVVRDKPICLLVREPDWAIASWIIYRRCFFPSAIDWYIGYYKALIPYLAGVQVITFAEATTDFPRVVQKINRRYSLSLSIPDYDKTFQRTVLDSVKQRGGDDFHVAVPNERRRKIEDRIVGMLVAPRFSQKMAEARALYSRLLVEACPIPVDLAQTHARGVKLGELRQTA